jgi:sulfur-carrier protein
MIRVILPTHLWRLAQTEREITLPVEGSLESAATISAVLDALEARYPALRGTIRDQSTHQRRDFIRFFACGEDWSLEPPDAPLPAEIVSGAQPLRVVGAMAGG